MGRAAALLAAILVAGTGCHRADLGSPSGTDADATTTSAAIDEGPGVIVADAPLENVDQTLHDSAAVTRGVTYVSRSGIDDAYTHVTASIFVPKGDRPAAGFPVVALATPVSGTTPDCGVSQSATLRGAAPVVVALLKAGYVVTVPDYQGLGKPFEDEGLYHPYLDATTVGYNVIDAVRAARHVAPDSSHSWAALGVREGGQAAWAADELAVTYGYGLKLVGAAAVSPVADVTEIADNAANGTLTAAQQVVYARYLEALHDEDGGIMLDDFRRGAAQQNWDSLLGCRSDAQAPAGDLAANVTAADLKPVDGGALTTLRGHLQTTTLPRARAQAPMLVTYGGADPAVPPAWTDRAVMRACQMGDVMTIAALPPTAPVPTDASTAMGWISDRFASAPPPDDCPAFSPTHR